MFFICKLMFLTSVNKTSLVALFLQLVSIHGNVAAAAVVVLCSITDIPAPQSATTTILERNTPCPHPHTFWSRPTVPLSFKSGLQLMCNYNVSLLCLCLVREQRRGRGGGVSNRRL